MPLNNDIHKLTKTFQLHTQGTVDLRDETQSFYDDISHFRQWTKLGLELKQSACSCAKSKLWHLKSAKSRGIT